MTPIQRAFIDIIRARATERAAADAETQIAYWLTQGQATLDDLIDARQTAKYHRTQHGRAKATYKRLCQLQLAPHPLAAHARTQLSPRVTNTLTTRKQPPSC
jgi:hypothetical protein